MYDDAVAWLRDRAADFPPESGVREDRMFNGRGLRTDAGFFAFVARTGDLVVRLPADEVVELAARGEGVAMTMGTRTMRQWARLSPPSDAQRSGWRDALRRAFEEAVAR